MTEQKKYDVVIDVEEITPTTGQSGTKYHKIKTSKGVFSVFEDSILKELKRADLEGNRVRVGIAEGENDRGYKFKNIREFIEHLEPDSDLEVRNENVEIVKMNEKVPQNGSKSGFKPYEKDPVGLCVELFYHMIDMRAKVDKPSDSFKAESLMEQCIELVKQAQSGFSE